MGLYQGRALRTEPRSRRRLPIAHMLAIFALLVLVAHLPWEGLRRRIAVVSEIRVEGAHTIDPARVADLAGVHRGDDLLRLDCTRARQALLHHARIASAQVSRRWMRGVRIEIAEREPVLLVRHGVPWELDSAGVLLAPLSEGVVADVPLLTGPDVARLSEGAVVNTVGVRRGLAWVQAMSVGELQLGGRISEIDVSDSRSTGILLMTGTRVLATVWPPDTRTLSALRVVLADLERRGSIALEVDLRFQNQVIVRPAGSDGGEVLARTGQS